VVTDETSCPFCATPLPDCFREVKRKPPRGRTSRAGLLAAGAGAALISACSSAVPVYGAPVGGNGGTMSDGAAGAGGSGFDAPVAAYGAPPASAEADPKPAK
jgi:hypothetical protein